MSKTTKTEGAKSKYHDNKRQRCNGKDNKPQWFIAFEISDGNLEDMPFGKENASVPT
jgi:hypothetical protein